MDCGEMPTSGTLMLTIVMWTCAINCISELSGGLNLACFLPEVLAITLGAEQLSEYTESFSDWDKTIFFSSRHGCHYSSGLWVQGENLLSTPMYRNSQKLCPPTQMLMLKWNKAHVGTAGNECTDQLAKQGTDSLCLWPELKIPVSFSYCKKQVWNWAWNTFMSRWDGDVHLGLTKELFQNPLDGKGTSKLLQLPRHRMRLVLQVLTGICPHLSQAETKCLVEQHRQSTPPGIDAKVQSIGQVSSRNRETKWTVNTHCDGW